jgi:integrase
VARPALDIGTFGNIATWIDKTTSKHIARAKFRDPDGVVRQVTRSGTTEAAATRNLKKALKERTVLGPAEELTPEDRLDKLLNVWWKWKLEDSGDVLAPSTVSAYESVMAKVIRPGLGQLKIRELSVGRLDRFLIATRASSVYAADLAKTILKMALDRAAQLDVITVNPAVSVTKPKKKRPEPRALTMNDLGSLRSALDGMRQKSYLPLMFEIQLAFAARIGEALALDWSDVNLDSTPPTVKIQATLARANNVVFRQNHTKSGPTGMRTLIASGWIIDMLRQHKAQSTGEGLVLRGRGGVMVMPTNARDSWRNIRDRVGLGWVKPHHMRKTALTMINAVYSSTEAAAFAGHTQVAVTDTYYIERDKEGMRPDVRLATDKFEPSNDRLGFRSTDE